jgi:hypothetical protein
MFLCLLDETCFDPAKHETYLRPGEIRVLKYGLAQRRPDFFSGKPIRLDLVVARVF